MKSIRMLLPATALSLVAGVSASSAAVLPLNPIIDGFVRQDQLATTGNANSAADILVGQTTNTNAFHGMLNFDLSLLPSNAVVTSVTLTLTQNATDTAATSTLGVYRLTEAYTANSADASSWLNRINNAGGVPAADTAWATAGGTFDSTLLSSGSFSVITTAGQVGTANTWSSSASFVSAVQSSIGLTLGLLVKDTDESNVARELFRFAGVENATAIRRPLLTIEYTTSSIPEPGSYALIVAAAGLGTALVARRRRR